MKIREILSEHEHHKNDDIYDKEHVWASLKDSNVVQSTLNTFNEYETITNSFQNHPIDVFEISDIYDIRQKLQNNLTIAEKIGAHNTATLIRRLLSYFSVTTYPE